MNLISDDTMITLKVESVKNNYKERESGKLRERSAKGVLHFKMKNVDELYKGVYIVIIQ